MDPIEQRQAEIEAKRAQLVRDYPRIWQKLIHEWSADSDDDRCWLTYAANYLFRTGGVRWAIDPYSLHGRLPYAGAVQTAQDLQPLDFILLTHRHADHLDRDLLRSLTSPGIRWVVPGFMLNLTDEIGIPRDQIMVPTVLQEFEVNGIRILPIEAQHFNLDEYGEMHGVPELGYRIEQNGQRWLFPGDTRDYNPVGLPDLGRIDTVFAHLWLGRREALSPDPLLLDDFCNFFLTFHPHRIIISHLEEVGRKAHSYWNELHFMLAARRFKQLDGSVVVEKGVIGQSIQLTE